MSERARRERIAPPDEGGPLFAVSAIEPVEVAGPRELAACDLMSPFVWRTSGGGLSVLLRAVPGSRRPDDATGYIWHGECAEDGLRMRMDETPLIVPGPDDLDIGGCEDPTVVPTGEDCVVYYTGLDSRGDGQMLYCEGPDIRRLTKRGVALASSKTERNTKEAAVERTSDGHWRLFYEYSRDCRSRVGLAYGRGPHGPWSEQDDPFVARPESWDSWHLSTGPLLMTDPETPVMFYNGADRDAVWGVGWIAFDRDCTHVVARSAEPLIAPPQHRFDGRDISFAASAIQAEEEIWLYGTRNDRRLFRARVSRTGPRCSPYI
jgi:predicted GH43/DUF377 family glycosyl hydrolase